MTKNKGDFVKTIGIGHLMKYDHVLGVWIQIKSFKKLLTLVTIVIFILEIFLKDLKWQIGSQMNTLTEKHKFLALTCLLNSKGGEK